MKKKLIIIIALVLVVGGLGAFFFFKSKSKGEEEKEVEVTKDWNAYSVENKKLVTLPDYTFSAVKGDYIVRMTVTLEFDGEESYQKYEGLNEPPAAEEAAEEGGHGSSSKEEDHVVTPMEVVINSEINTFMLQTTEEKVVNKPVLEEEIKTYLNEKLATKLKNGKTEKPLLKRVYIENYIVN